MALSKTDLENIKKVLKSELEALRKTIYQDVGNLVDERILPQINSLNDSVEGINRKFNAVFERGDRHSKKLTEHERRITKLEGISSVS